MKNLLLYQQALLELIKIGIGTSDGSFDFSRLSHDEWEDVLHESKAHAIGLLCFDSTSSCVNLIPKDIYKQWLGHSAKVIANNIEVQSGQKWLVDLLEKNNIPYVILKGLSTASFYPDYEKRSCGDVDFITPPEFLEKTEKLLLQNGCIKDERHTDVHYVYNRAGITYELHFEISGTPDGIRGEIVKEYFSSIVSNFNKDEETSFKRPSVEHNGAVVFFHIIHHLLSVGIGLRQICDWTCFVNKTLNDKFWTSSFIPLLEKIGLKYFLMVLTSASVRYMGISKPIWLEMVDDEISNKFILEVLRAGNFGKKEKELAGTGIMFSKDRKNKTLSSKISTMLRTLNSTNHKVYPILDKAPWLYPFVMLRRIIKFVFLLFIGTRQSLLNASKYADQKGDLVSLFGLYNEEVIDNE